MVIISTEYELISHTHTHIYIDDANLGVGWDKHGVYYGHPKAYRNL